MAKRPSSTHGQSRNRRRDPPPENGSEPLEVGVRRRFEDQLDADLSGVRIRSSGAGLGLAGYRAVTVGDEIRFPAGQYDPQSAAGSELLAHELTHVVQQRRGGPTTSTRPGPASEREARSLAPGLAAGQPAAVHQATAVGPAADLAHYRTQSPTEQHIQRLSPVQLEADIIDIEDFLATQTHSTAETNALHQALDRLHARREELATQDVSRRQPISSRSTTQAPSNSTSNNGSSPSLSLPGPDFSSPAELSAQADRLTLTELEAEVTELRRLITLTDSGPVSSPTTERLRIFEQSMIERQQHLIDFRSNLAQLRQVRREHGGATTGLDAIFAMGFISSMASELPIGELQDLENELLSQPHHFVGGYYVGLPVGVWTGLTGLVGGLWELVKLGFWLSPIGIGVTAVIEAGEIVDDPEGYIAEKYAQYQKLRAVYHAVSAFGDEVRQDPTVFMQLSADLGEALGSHAMASLTANFFRQTPFAKGQFIGRISGVVLFEVLLEIVLAVTTGLIGNAARGLAATGQGIRVGGRLATVFKQALRSADSLRDLFRIVDAAEDAGDAARHLPAGGPVGLSNELSDVVTPSPQLSSPDPVPTTPPSSSTRTADTPAVSSGPDAPSSASPQAPDPPAAATADGPEVVRVRGRRPRSDAEVEYSASPNDPPDLDSPDVDPPDLDPPGRGGPGGGGGSGGGSGFTREEILEDIADAQEIPTTVRRRDGSHRQRSHSEVERRRRHQRRPDSEARITAEKKRSHDMGVRGGRAQAQDEGITVRNWVTPQQMKGSYGRGFDDLGDLSGETVIIEHKGGPGARLGQSERTGYVQMSSEWVGQKIAELEVVGDTATAQHLLQQLQSGRLRGVVYQTLEVTPGVAGTERTARLLGRELRAQGVRVRSRQGLIRYGQTRVMAAYRRELRRLRRGLRDRDMTTLQNL
jgi:hypothetical protein